jgi:hypothetical protein
MRSIPIVVFVLSLGVAFAVVTGSGIGTTIFGVGDQDPGTQRALNDSANETRLEDDGDSGGIAGDVQGDNEPTIVGLVLSAGQTVISIATAVVLLPVTLSRLGFPVYFAAPVGLFAQMVVGIGVFQFIVGRVWE